MVSDSTDYDVIILGGGPAGSTTAAFLRQKGRRVLVLEREKFPRFHIGESLLPYIVPLLKEMGAYEKVCQAGFMEKYGARFVMADSSKAIRADFGMSCFTEEPMAWQVERSRFDELLLRHAESLGAEVREEHHVTDYRIGPDQVEVSARDAARKTHTFTAKFLVDATGRGNLTGNREKLRQDDPKLKKLAIFGHFTNVKLDQHGKEAGDISIVRLPDRWFWVIPLTPEKVSIGLVMDRAAFTQQDKQPERVFWEVIDATPEIRDRLQEAELGEKLHVTTDFSYRNKNFQSPRLVRVGDAAGFMDPIFSSGVHLAMYSARDAAAAVHETLEAGAATGPALLRYEKEFRRMMSFYWEFVDRFYTWSFMEVLLQPEGNTPQKLKLPQAINSALAGRMTSNWAIKWRLRYFFIVVAIQKYIPLLPRVTWDTMKPLQSVPESARTIIRLEGDEPPAMKVTTVGRP